MNPITKTIKESGEEFEQEFGAFAILGKAGRFYNGAFGNEARIKEAQDFLLQSQLYLLTAIKEEVENIKQKVKKRYGTAKYDRCYNDILTLLQETKQELKI